MVSIFIAPAGTPLPNGMSTNGTPVTIDEQGATEWEPVRGLLSEEEAWERAREAARPAIEWVMEQVKAEAYWRVKRSPARKRDRILARQIARSEHYIKARPLLNNGKAWRG